MPDHIELAARALLNTIDEWIAAFQRPTSELKEHTTAQMQYTAIATMLRSVGHVFAKVDCQTASRDAWAKREWSTFKEEPIFKDFIDYNRNLLLKEYRGALQLGDRGMKVGAVSIDLSLPGDVRRHVDLRPEEIVAPNGRAALPQFQEAVRFWNRYLSEAEREFHKL